MLVLIIATSKCWTNKNYKQCCLKKWTATERLIYTEPRWNLSDRLVDTSENWGTNLVKYYSYVDWF